MTSDIPITFFYRAIIHIAKCSIIQAYGKYIKK